MRIQYRKRHISFFVVLVVLSLYLPLGAIAAPSNTEKSRNLKNLLTSGSSKTLRKAKNNFREGEVLVKFKKDSIDVSRFLGRLSVKSFELTQGLERKEILAPQNLALMKSRTDETTERLIARLKNDPRVEYVEPNFIRHFSSIPNDTDFQNLWGLDNTGQMIDSGDLFAAGTDDADIDAPEAWDKYTGGTDVTVAVLDTGIAYNHPDLINNMWSGSSECKDDSNNTISGGCANHGWDFVNDDNDPIDDQGHGTHVAGTIGAEGNNSRGITGVNWTTKIMAVKVGNAQGFIVSDWVKGLNFAKNNGAKIVNASFGGSEFSQTELDAIASFPGLFVAAAGNGGADGIGDNNDTIPFYPASYDASNIISVAATDQDDNMVSFSNYGETSVDVAAPGLNIYSTYPVFSTPFQETFDEVTAPDIGSQFTKGGTSNNWGTYDVNNKFLWTDIVNIPYANNANTSVTSSAIDLSGKTGATLSFYVHCDTDQTADWTDYLSLDLSADGTNFTEVERFDEVVLGGNLGLYEANISPYMSETTQIRFRWTTNGSNEIEDGYAGCYVDKPTVSSVEPTGENYGFSHGTSMAAPHVAGLAALLKSYNPILPDAQIKEIILNTGNELPADFIGKTASGKRVNAQNSLEVFSPRGGFDVADSIPASQIAQFTDGSGQVQVNFRAQDGVAGIPMGIILSSFQYSLDGGETFTTPPENLVFFSFPFDQTIVSSTDLSGPIYNFLIQTKSLTGLENSDESNVVIRFKLYDGVDGLQSPYITSESFRVNNTTPTATLSNTPPSQTSMNTADITVGGTNVVTYSYALKNDVDNDSSGSDIPVNEHIQSANLTDGTHVLGVYGKDAQGNVQQEPTLYSWLVDTTGPSGTITNASGNPTNVATPMLNLAISDAGVGTEGAEMQFSCDDATWTDFEPFQSTKTDFNVSSDLNGCANSDGAKTVYTQLKDSLGNIGASFNTGEFVLNSSEALAQFTLTPSNPSNDRNPQFTVGGTDIVAYQFQIDGNGFSEETSILSGIQLSDLADGNYTIQIIGKNNAGTWQSEDNPTEFTWLLDATGPTLTLAPETLIMNEDGSLSTNAVTPTLVIALNDFGVGTDDATIRFSCDGESWTDFEDFEDPKNGFNLRSGLFGCEDADGAKTVFAQAQDSLGNLGEAAQTETFTLDSTPPDITGLISDITPVQSKTWEWDSSDESAVFQFAIDQLEDGAATGQGEYDVVKTATQPTGDGTFYLHVQAKDALGNESAVTTVSAVLDNTAPTATFTNAPNNPTKFNSINVTVSGAGVTHYRFKIDAADFGAETPVGTPITATDLSEGEHMLEVMGRDTAGNYQSEANSTRITWIVDTTLVTAVIGGTPSNPTNSTTTDITISGTNVDFYKFKVDDGSLSAEKTVNEHITLSSLTEGVHKIAVLGKSTAGSYPVEAEATIFSWTIDLTPPAAVLTGAPAGEVTATTATITVSGEGVTHYKFILDTQPIGPETQISTPIELTSLGLGSHTLKVMGRDNVGNYQIETNATLATWIVKDGGGGGGGGGGGQPPPPPPVVQPTPPVTPPGRVLGAKKQRFPNGTIVKLRGKKRYYLIKNGERKLLSLNNFRKNYEKRNVIELSKKALEEIPLMKKKVNMRPITITKKIENKTKIFIEVAFLSVRIRDGIGYQAKILDTVKKGQRFEIIEEKDGWYKIIWKNNESVWIEGKWVKKIN